MEVKLRLDQKGEGGFYLMDSDKQIGEMELAIVGNTLTVFHTEVEPGQESKGLAKLLLDAMVAYARGKNLEVIPLCPYVHAQFKRHPKEYADIWKHSEK